MLFNVDFSLFHQLQFNTGYIFTQAYKWQFRKKLHKKEQIFMQLVLAKMGTAIVNDHLNQELKFAYKPTKFHPLPFSSVVPVKNLNN